MKALAPRVTAAVLATAAALVAQSAHVAPAVSASASQKAAIDAPAPDFTLADTGGRKHTLSDYKGKFVVLEWNNWDCPFVKKHYRSNNMQSLQKKYGDRGVVWLTICSSAPGKQGHYEPADLIERCREAHWAGSAYLQDPDGVVGRLYGARTTPHMFVIDPKGVLVYAGAIDDRRSTNPEDVKGARNYVAVALDAAMTGRPVETKTSTPYGCSVKYR